MTAENIEASATIDITEATPPSPEVPHPENQGIETSPTDEIKQQEEVNAPQEEDKETRFVLPEPDIDSLSYNDILEQVNPDTKEELVRITDRISKRLNGDGNSPEIKDKLMREVYAIWTEQEQRNEEILRNTLNKEAEETALTIKRIYGNNTQGIAESAFNNFNSLPKPLRDSLLDNNLIFRNDKGQYLSSNPAVLVLLSKYHTQTPNPKTSSSITSNTDRLDLNTVLGNSELLKIYTDRNHPKHQELIDKIQKNYF